MDYSLAWLSHGSSWRAIGSCPSPYLRSGAGRGHLCLRGGFCPLPPAGVAAWWSALLSSCSEKKFIIGIFGILIKLLLMLKAGAVPQVAVDLAGGPRRGGAPVAPRASSSLRAPARACRRRHPAPCPSSRPLVDIIAWQWRGDSGWAVGLHGLPAGLRRRDRCGARPLQTRLHQRLRQAHHPWPRDGYCSLLQLGLGVGAVHLGRSSGGSRSAATAAGSEWDMAASLAPLHLHHPLCRSVLPGRLRHPPSLAALPRGRRPTRTSPTRASPLGPWRPRLVAVGLPESLRR